MQGGPPTRYTDGVVTTPYKGPYKWGNWGYSYNSSYKSYDSYDSPHL